MDHGFTELHLGHSIPQSDNAVWHGEGVDIVLDSSMATSCIITIVYIYMEGFAGV